MEVEKITPAGRRWQRVAMRIGIFAALYAALKVNSLFEGGRLITVLIIVAAFFLAFYFTSREWLKTVIAVLAACFLLFWVEIRPLVRESRVSTSAISPDGRVVAEVFELGGFMAIDRNFIVRLKSEGPRGIAQYKRLFRSPDEGRPPTERLLWSKDGRYLLLLGKSISVIGIDSCLDSGECLYLLVDTEQDIVYSNASQLRERRPFSVNDLSGIDFGESFTPADQVTN